MSLQALAWAIEDAPDVPHHCVSVLVALANRSDEHGRDAYPSIARLAHAARKSPRQVQRALDELEDLQLIRRGDQRAAYRLRSDRRPTVWDLRMDRRRPVFTAERGDTHVTPKPGRGDTDDVSSASRGDVDDVSWKARGDTGDVHGVTPTSPEPSTEPSSTTEGRYVTDPRDDDEPPHPDARVEATTPRTAVDHGRGAPPERCPAHLDAPTPGPCPPCGDARRAHTAWRDQLTALQSAARAAVATEQAAAREADRRAIANCTRCDDRGLTEHGVRCTHTGDTSSLPPGRAAYLAERQRLADRKGTPAPAVDPELEQPAAEPTPEPAADHQQPDDQQQHPEQAHHAPTAWSADDPPF